ncbi:AhpC/TSA family protein [Natronincola ferrireducens]|uniref:AhpC/TSA family protein n=1 Tax=Natronincola ferrireducens TaxID=393762 RepID=A0A1G8ZIE8_9FIRM|nr:AhpC/TSA family protein [Natronincola ferrireducens]
MSHLDEFHRTYIDKDVVVIGISLGEKPETVRTFMEERGYNFPVLLDEELDVGFTYQVRYTPTTYVINKEGKIIGRGIGPLDFEKLKEIIQ